jgi:hypothetical protein
MSTEATTLALTLGKGDVERIIQETIRTQVALALTNNGPGLIESIVTQTLMERRDYNDRPSSSDRDPTMLQKVVSVEVRKATIEAVQAWVESNRPAFAAAVEKCLKAQTKKIAESMVEAFVGCAKDQYRMSIAICIPKGER